jgi:hypothetical protein
MFVCSDTDYCEGRRAAAQQAGRTDEADAAHATTEPPHA